MQIRSVGIGLGKTTFHLVALGVGANLQTSWIALKPAREPFAWPNSQRSYKSSRREIYKLIDEKSIPALTVER
jgi:hypothetical protein